MDFWEFLILLKAKYGFVRGYSLIQSKPTYMLR